MVNSGAKHLGSDLGKFLHTLKLGLLDVHFLSVEWQ